MKKTEKPSNMEESIERMSALPESSRSSLYSESRLIDGSLHIDMIIEDDKKVMAAEAYKRRTQQYFIVGSMLLLVFLYFCFTHSEGISTGEFDDDSIKSLSVFIISVLTPIASLFCFGMGFYRRFKNYPCI